MSTTDTITCHHGLGPAHPWQPSGYCPPEPVEPAPDTERDERLREARAAACVYSEAAFRGEPTLTPDQHRLVHLYAEVARQAAAIQSVEALIAEDYKKSGREVSCGGYLVTDDGCFAGTLADRIRRALDGAEQ